MAGRRFDLPRVSIGLPVYNGERFVAHAIDSILNQSFSDLELIISDNGSTDGTAAIVQSYAKRDPRVRFFRSEENRGAAWNFNRVFAAASGKYFKWAAADDMCRTDFLARAVEILDSDPSVVLCHCKVAQIDEAGEQVGFYEFEMRTDSPHAHERFRDLIVVRHDCYAVFGLVRTEALRKTPLIGSYVGSDRVLLGEFGLMGKLHEIPEILFYRRKHQQNSVCLDERGARLAWFDPRKAGKINLPHWRILWEYLRAIWRVRLGPAASLRCCGQLLAHLRIRRRFLWRDLVEALKKLLGRSRAGQRLLLALKQVSQVFSG